MKFCKVKIFSACLSYTENLPKVCFMAKIKLEAETWEFCGQNDDKAKDAKFFVCGTVCQKRGEPNW